MTKQIQERLDTLITYVKQSCDHLLKEISAKDHANRDRLDAEKASVSAEKKSLSDLLARADSAECSDAEVIELRKKLKDAIKKHRETVRGQTVGSEWRYGNSDTLRMDDITPFIGWVVEEGGHDVTIPMSLTELADQVKDVKETATNLTSRLSECRNEIDNLKKTNADLKKAKSSLENDLSSVKQKQRDFEKNLSPMKGIENEFEKKTSSLSKEVAALEKKTSSLGSDVTSLKETKSELQKAVSSLKEREADRERTASRLSADLEAIGRTNTALAKRFGKCLCLHLTSALNRFGKCLVFTFNLSIKAIW